MGPENGFVFSRESLGIVQQRAEIARVLLDPVRVVVVEQRPADESGDETDNSRGKVAHWMDYSMT